MPPRKEDQIQIPEAVLNRANAAAIRGQAVADTGSIFTERERTLGKLPQFPFGGARSTSMDVIGNVNFPNTPAEGFSRENPNRGFLSLDNQKLVQYEQDAATRIANRYTAPTNFVTFENPFGSRLSNTLYSDPYQAFKAENRRAELNTFYPPSTSPNVGTSGFTRSVPLMEGAGRVEQIVSPYGFASTTLTPQQIEQRAMAVQKAEQNATMPRTPEQQQQLLAQMRERGEAIRKNIAGFQEQGFAAKRAELNTVNDLINKTVAAGFTPNEARAMARPYYESQPSSIGAIQRDFANYRDIGYAPMGDFMQKQIRSLFPANLTPKNNAPQPIAGGFGSPNMPIFVPIGNASSARTGETASRPQVTTRSIPFDSSMFPTLAGTPSFE